MHHANITSVQLRVMYIFHMKMWTKITLQLLISKCPFFASKQENHSKISSLHLWCFCLDVKSEAIEHLWSANSWLIFQPKFISVLWGYQLQEIHQCMSHSCEILISLIILIRYFVNFLNVCFCLVQMSVVIRNLKCNVC